MVALLVSLLGPEITTLKLAQFADNVFVDFHVLTTFIDISSSSSLFGVHHISV